MGFLDTMNKAKAFDDMQTQASNERDRDAGAMRELVAQENQYNRAMQDEQLFNAGLAAQQKVPDWKLGLSAGEKAQKVIEQEMMFEGMGGGSWNMESSGLDSPEQADKKAWEYIKAKAAAGEQAAMKALADGGLASQYQGGY